MKISVVTPTLNAEATIEQCLESVAAQSFEVEHIVVDGGSTDATQEVVSGFQPAVAQLLTGPDDGMYDAINKGIDVATGEFVAILNADDEYAHDRVIRNVVALIDASRTDTCYGDLAYRDADGHIIRRWKAGPFHPRKFLWGWMPPHPTFFVRREIYECYGTYRTDLGTASDYELMLRLLYKHDVTCSYLPERLVNMRSGGASNKTFRARLQANRMDRKAWAVNELTPYPWTTLMKPLRKLGQWL